MPIYFYTFSFGCATPFCNNRSFAQGVPPLCGQVRFLPFSLLRLFRSFPFPGRMITASRWGAPFLSILNRHVPLRRRSFEQGLIFRLRQSRSKAVMYHSGYTILHRLSARRAVPCVGMRISISRYSVRLLVSHLFIIAFCRSNHHFSVAKIVCGRERPGALDQWHRYTIFLYRAFRFCLRSKIKRIVSAILGASLGSTYFLRQRKTDSLTSKSNSK